MSNFYLDTLGVLETHAKTLADIKYIGLKDGSAYLNSYLFKTLAEQEKDASNCNGNLVIVFYDDTWLQFDVSEQEDIYGDMSWEYCSVPRKRSELAVLMRTLQG